MFWGAPRKLFFFLCQTGNVLLAASFSLKRMPFPHNFFLFPDFGKHCPISSENTTRISFHEVKNSQQNTHRTAPNRIDQAKDRYSFSPRSTFPSSSRRVVVLFFSFSLLSSLPLLHNFVLSPTSKHRRSCFSLFQCIFFCVIWMFFTIGEIFLTAREK